MMMYSLSYLEGGQAAAFHIRDREYMPIKDRAEQQAGKSR